jgi:hypothetical protein
MNITKSPAEKIKLPDAGLEAEISVCPNTNCNCGTVYFCPKCEDFSTEGRLIVDVFSNDITYERLDCKSNDKLENFKKNISARDWEYLFDCYAEAKKRLSKEAPLSLNEYYFDFEDIEKEAMLIPYNEVFPFENDMIIDCGSKQLEIYDVYCLNSHCNCSDAVVELLDIETESGMLSQGGFTINYRNSEWYDVFEGDDFFADYIPLPVLKTLAENQIPDFYEKLKERHQKLRQLYALRRSQLFGSGSAKNKRKKTKKKKKRKGKK